MPAPRNRWEEQVDRAMRVVARVFGDGTPDNPKPYLYTPKATNVSYSVDGVFESATATVDLDTGLEGVTYAPRLAANVSEFQSLPVQGDRVVIRGKLYAVTDPQFDGQGTVTLRLHEA
jgi:hypothetical protein